MMSLILLIIVVVNTFSIRKLKASIRSLDAKLRDMDDEAAKDARDFHGRICSLEARKKQQGNENE